MISTCKILIKTVNWAFKKASAFCELIQLLREKGGLPAPQMKRYYNVLGLVAVWTGQNRNILENLELETPFCQHGFGKRNQHILNSGLHFIHRELTYP